MMIRPVFGAIRRGWRRQHPRLHLHHPLYRDRFPKLSTRYILPSSSSAQIVGRGVPCSSAPCAEAASSGRPTAHPSGPRAIGSSTADRDRDRGQVRPTRLARKAPGRDSIRLCLKTAAWDDDYLAKIIAA